MSNKLTPSSFKTGSWTLSPGAAILKQPQIPDPYTLWTWEVLKGLKLESQNSNSKAMIRCAKVHKSPNKDILYKERKRIIRTFGRECIALAFLTQAAIIQLGVVA